jgi:protease IV
MGKFLLGVATGLALTFLVFILVVMAAIRFKAKPPEVASGSTLILRLDGDIPERPPVEIPIPFLQDRNAVTIANVWGLLRRAAADSRIKALVIEPDGLQIGWAKLEELRSDIESFKKSGKPVVAFLRSAGTREYYLATAANKIYMTPEDMLNLKGMRFELMYFKKTLDKLGVGVQVEHAGKYKDFGDMFTRSNMSQETKDVLNSVLDDLYGNLVQTIAKARKKTPDEVKAIIDEGPFISAQVVGKGLVDEVRFEDQMFGELKAMLKGGEIKKLTSAKYLRALEGEGSSAKHRIAYLVGQGGITRGDPDNNGLSDEGITSEGFDKLLRQVGSDSNIKGVIVRIDSPGGEVTASDEIWREMMLLRQKKPLIISMSDTAASGGYYMAMTGDPVLAYPGTLTGSIGVVYGKPDLHGLYDKLGITKDSIQRGRFADIDSDYKPLDAAGLAKLREGIDESYKEFVTKVAQARKKTFAEIEPIAQGRVWLGSQAKANGLVDELGGLDRAVEIIKQKAKIPQADKVALVPYPPKRSLLELLMSRSSENSAETKLRALLNGWQTRIWLTGGYLRLMPYSISIH